MTMLESKKRGKTCSSGIGEDRIKQHEQAQALLAKSKLKNPCKFGTGAVENIDGQFNNGPREIGMRQKKRDINMIDYDRATRWRYRRGK